jgi:hypothetical protein
MHSTGDQVGPKFSRIFKQAMLRLAYRETVMNPAGHTTGTQKRCERVFCVWGCEKRESRLLVASLTSRPTRSDLLQVIVSSSLCASPSSSCAVCGVLLLLLVRSSPPPRRHGLRDCLSTQTGWARSCLCWSALPPAHLAVGEHGAVRSPPVQREVLFLSGTKQQFSHSAPLSLPISASHIMVALQQVPLMLLLLLLLRPEVGASDEANAAPRLTILGPGWDRQGEQRALQERLRIGPLASLGCELDLGPGRGKLRDDDRHGSGSKRAHGAGGALLPSRTAVSPDRTTPSGPGWPPLCRHQRRCAAAGMLGHTAHS